MYLPAIFIYKDIKYCNFQDVVKRYNPGPGFQQAFIHEASGNYVMKYSAGQAVVMAPFFFAGHLWAKASANYPADGFSYPYQFSIGFGMFLYALAGLFFLRKVLLEYFRDSSVAILLIGYAVGSNYLNYSSVDQAMTHSSLFTIYALLIYLTIKFHKAPTYWLAIIIGSLCGLSALIRPTDVIAVLIPICWNVSNMKDARSKILFVKHNALKFLLLFIFMGVIGAIQLVYWKYVSGDWIVYSYQEQGFSWLHPHIYNYTLSYKCGWLRYCPIMFFPLIGLWLYAKNGVHKLAIILFTLLNFYIVTAWDIWDYGGTAGRAMVQAYPVLAFPFALLIEIANKKKWLMGLFYPVFILFIYINIWWTWNAHKAGVQVMDVTRQYYWKKIGRWSVNESDIKLLDNKYSYEGGIKKFVTIYSNNFDTDSSVNLEKSNNGGRIKIDKELQYSQQYFVRKPFTVNKWIRVSADFYCVNKEWEVWRMAQFMVKFYKDEQDVQSNFIRVNRFIGDLETKKIFIDAIVPTKDWNRMSIQFWNAESDKELLIDNLEVITFEEQ